VSLDGIRSGEVYILAVAGSNLNSNYTRNHRPAQVHLATDASGRKLAVKVQHRGLRELSRGDVAAVSFFVNAVAAAFPEFR